MGSAGYSLSQMLSFKLLGQVSLNKNGEPLKQFRSQKEVALLAFLAQTGQIHRREFLAEMLWDDRSTQQALSNLRTILTRLRPQVGDTLHITRNTLALDPEVRKRVDLVVLLHTLTSIGKINSAEKAATLQKALDTYQGDFLAGFYLSDAPRFNKWILATREHMRRQVIAAYDKLGQYARSTGDIEYGIAISRRWIQVIRSMKRLIRC